MLSDTSQLFNSDDGRRKASERAFHNDRYGADADPRRELGKWYAAVDHGARLQLERIRQFPAEACVLEYGCADGRLSLLEQQLAQRFKAFSGIDLSDQAIVKARQTAAKQALKHCRFEVMDAEAMTFADASFDLVFGRGIIHHLQLDRCFAEIKRVLKPGGSALFLEPLGHNPILNWYRGRTPEMRTPDEHPLRARDFELARTFFRTVELSYFGLSTLLAIPLGKSAHARRFMALCRATDRYLLRLPVVQRQAWFVLMHMRR
jgi:SAM-dependent methyltransferase